MPVLLVTGTGDAGASTVAAATAVASARSGQRTVLIDLAGHGDLDDLLGDDVLEGGPGEAATNLTYWRAPRFATVMDTPPWALPTGWAGALMTQLGLGSVPAEVLGAVPGFDDLAAWGALLTQQATPEVDLVVADLGDLHRALALIELPETWLRHLGHLLDVDARVARALTLDDDPLEVGAQAVIDLCQAVEALLHGTDCSLRVVSQSSPLALRRLTRAVARLALHEIRIDSLVLRSADGSAPDLDQVRGWGWPVQGWPIDADADVIGTSALTALADSFPPVFASPRAEELPHLAGSAGSVTRDGERFALSLSLPGAVHKRVELARRGDDLLVDIADHRRVLPLPSVLQRCLVESASWRQDTLEIVFAPNPDLWPLS